MKKAYITLMAAVALVGAGFEAEGLAGASKGLPHSVVVSAAEKLPVPQEIVQQPALEIPAARPVNKNLTVKADLSGVMSQIQAVQASNDSLIDQLNVANAQIVEANSKIANYDEKFADIEAKVAGIVEASPASDDDAATEAAPASFMGKLWNGTKASAKFTAKWAPTIAVYLGIGYAGYRYLLNNEVMNSPFVFVKSSS